MRNKHYIVGDRFVTKDYLYELKEDFDGRYCLHSNDKFYWSVRVRFDRIYREYYEDIPEAVAGYPVKDLDECFKGCLRMKEVPTIKAKVTKARDIYRFCNSLEFVNAQYTDDHPFYKDTKNNIIGYQWITLNFLDNLKHWECTVKNDKVYLHRPNMDYLWSEQWVFVPAEIEGKRVVIDIKDKGLFERTPIGKVIFDDNVDFGEYGFVNMFKNCINLKRVYNYPTEFTF